ncbi:hypothetical protein F4859DRAFT_523689 [Xylaria cf. heliscus]|nr:hypothetical protein F4859DRAFT_523689 [Xylaria cf. heliscus]
MSQDQSNTAPHTAAHAGASMSMTHPALVWSQVQEQKQLRKSTPKVPMTTKDQSSSAASVLSHSTTYSYQKEQSAAEPKSLSQKIKKEKPIQKRRLGMRDPSMFHGYSRFEARVS